MYFRHKHYRLLCRPWAQQPPWHIHVLGALMHPTGMQIVMIFLFTMLDPVPTCPGLRGSAWFCKSCLRSTALFPRKKLPEGMGFKLDCLMFSICLRASKVKINDFEIFLSFSSQKRIRCEEKRGTMHSIKINWNYSIFSV